MLKDYYNKIDKRKFFIYLFSFLIFVLVNNLFVNLLRLSIGLELYFNVVNAFMCWAQDTLYQCLFQGFKIILFLGFIFCVKKHAESLLTEFFIAYFIYDLVFIFVRLFEIFIPIKGFYPIFFFVSSPQTATQSISLVIAVGWVLLLLSTLWKFNKLNINFLVKRLVLIPLSIIVVIMTFYIAGVVN